MTARATRELVRTRARGRCEYCRLRQEDLSIATFHVDHIVPRQHGGSDDPDNLALACHHCNLHKGPNLTGIDPETGGRATVHVLGMNTPTRIELRATLGAQPRRT